MLINQALSEVLQLVACQLFPFSSVVFACFAPVTKNRKLTLDDRVRPSASSVAEIKRPEHLCMCDGRALKRAIHHGTCTHQGAFLYRLSTTVVPSYKQVCRGTPWAVV